jgi:hypothetical protein
VLESQRKDYVPTGRYKRFSPREFRALPTVLGQTGRRYGTSSEPMTSEQGSWVELGRGMGDTYLDSAEWERRTVTVGASISESAPMLRWFGCGGIQGFEGCRSAQFCGYRNNEKELSIRIVISTRDVGEIQMESEIEKSQYKGIGRCLLSNVHLTPNSRVEADPDVRIPKLKQCEYC